MGESRGRSAWIGLLALAMGLWAGVGSVAVGQFDAEEGGSQVRFELSDAVQLDLADSTVQSQLQRAEGYLAEKQWDDAIDTLSRVMEDAGDRLVAVSPTASRYIPVREYCHRLLAGMEPEGLARYRSRKDPLAEKWYREGIQQHDPGPLREVLRQAFASSWGDDALDALGEMALENGDYGAARWHWRRILPVEAPPDEPVTWLAFPDTDLDPAAIRARLVLVSILEGSASRARDELARFRQLHPDVRGRFGGREVNYAEALAGLLAQSSQWPERKPTWDWLTFAGSPARNKVAPPLVDVSDVAWRVALRETTGERALAPPEQVLRKRVAEDAEHPLSYFPVVAGNVVLVHNQTEILALDVATGRPAFSSAAIHRERLTEVSDVIVPPTHTLGVPRFTLTVCGTRLYARMGSALTRLPLTPDDAPQPGYLVCRDLAYEGRLVWKVKPEVAGWAMEGTPLADAENVYVAMRHSGVKPEAYVACFDAETGRRRWRTLVCAAESPARTDFYEATHNLLTLHGDTIYYNTNLGVVAAISARDGRLQWIYRYPRAGRVDLVAPLGHWSRDLNPCLYDRGVLMVAPADSPSIFALDVQTGRRLWETGSEVGDAVHLLGVVGDHLIASGYRLYWISLRREDAGHVDRMFPDSAEKLGHGRGVLAGDEVWWPTRERIFVLDGRTAEPKRVIPLVPLGLTGGNLVIAGGRLLIATEGELIAMNRLGRPPQAPNERTAGKGKAPRGTDFQSVTPCRTDFQSVHEVGLEIRPTKRADAGRRSSDRARVARPAAAGKEVRAPLLCSTADTDPAGEKRHRYSPDSARSGGGIISSRQGVGSLFGQAGSYTESRGPKRFPTPFAQGAGGTPAPQLTDWKSVLRRG